jgi:hypothetical protein
VIPRHKPKRGVDAETADNGVDICVGACHQHRVSGGGRSERLAQPAGGQEPLIEIRSRHHQQFDIPPQPHMLKPIVQKMNGASEAALRQSS